MITSSLDDLLQVLSTIKKFVSSSADSPTYPCPYCNIILPIPLLCQHVPLYHTREPNGLIRKCTVCNYSTHNFAVHLHDEHAQPPESNSDDTHKRLPIFALVVCRNRKGEYLLVDEVAGQGFWLPGGAVDPGEDLVAAATRETMEEAGVEVNIKGVLRVEFTPSTRHYPRMRVIFYAEPKDDIAIPKSIPDYESAGACYVDAELLGIIPLRGREPLMWAEYLANGGQIYPLSVLARERDDVVVVS